MHSLHSFECFAQNALTWDDPYCIFLSSALSYCAGCVAMKRFTTKFIHEFLQVWNVTRRFLIHKFLRQVCFLQLMWNTSRDVMTFWYREQTKYATQIRLDVHMKYDYAEATEPFLGITRGAKWSPITHKYHYLYGEHWECLLRRPQRKMERENVCISNAKR